MKMEPIVPAPLTVPMLPASRAGQPRSSFRARCAALVFAGASLLASAGAQTVDPAYAGTYSVVNLGAPGDVPTSYGGLTFQPGNANTLLIGGGANNTTAKIYSLPVLRGAGGHITGFAANATPISTAAGTSGGIDGGLTFGPGNVLFYTSYSSNEIGEIKPGSSVPDKLVSLTPLGITSSVGSLVFVPNGFPGAGRAKILSYSGNSWYDAEASDDGSGTFDFGNVGAAINFGVPTGPEGATYISTANPLFPNPSVLVAAYSAGKVVAYDVDANGDPVLATVRDFITGLIGAEGATIDPVTGDFLFSTYGGGGKIIAVQGFVAPVPPATPSYTALYTKGDPVPTAETDPRIQKGAVWSGLGSPAINDGGQVAYVGKWKAPAFKTPVVLKAQAGVGIFVNDDLLVKAGDPVPGISNTVFKSFKDPVMDSSGHVAFLAAIKGAAGAAAVPSNADTVVVTNGRDGNLEILAREGDPAPGTGGALFKMFNSVSIKFSPAPVMSQIGGDIIVTPMGSQSGIVFTAVLLPGSGMPAIVSTNDAGSWWLRGGGTAVEKVIRESDAGFFGPGPLVKSSTLLKPLGGSPAFGRGQVNGDTLYLLAASTARTQGLILFHGATAMTNVLTGDLLNSVDLPTAKWAKLNLPSMDESGTNVSMLGMLKTGPTGVPSAQAKGIFQSLDSGADWEPMVRSGDDAPGFAKAAFSAFKDPVNSPTCADVAFAGTAKGGDATMTTNDGIWFHPDFGSLTLIAREGALPPGAPEGAKYKSFSSLALPGGDFGPLFTAMLQKGPQGTPGPGGITSVDDFALYGRDQAGTLFELLRENQPVLGKPVKRFSVLKAAPGTAGTTRNFNNYGQIVALVTFLDNSVSIIRIDLPTTNF